MSSSVLARLVSYDGGAGARGGNCSATGASSTRDKGEGDGGGSQEYADCATLTGPRSGVLQREAGGDSRSMARLARRVVKNATEVSRQPSLYVAEYSPAEVLNPGILSPTARALYAS